MTQTEIQSKIRDTLNEQLGLKVRSDGVRPDDPDEIPVDERGHPTWSPLNAPVIVNTQTVSEMDDLLEILKANQAPEMSDVDPLLQERGGDL